MGPMSRLLGTDLIMERVIQMVPLKDKLRIQFINLTTRNQVRSWFTRARINIDVKELRVKSRLTIDQFVQILKLSKRISGLALTDAKWCKDKWPVIKRTLLRAQHVTFGIVAIKSTWLQPNECMIAQWTTVTFSKPFDCENDLANWLSLVQMCPKLNKIYIKTSESFIKSQCPLSIISRRFPQLMLKVKGLSISFSQPYELVARKTLSSAPLNLDRLGLKMTGQEESIDDEMEAIQSYLHIIHSSKIDYIEELFIDNGSCLPLTAPLLKTFSTRWSHVK